MPSAIRGRAALWACIATAAGLAHASGFDISPTRVELSPATQVKTLRLRNPSQEKVGFEVVVKRWTMAADGSWVLEDLSGPSALVVHPLSFEVAPGQTQLLRVGLARPAPAGPETAYRLLVREMPSAAASGGASKVAVLTQLSLPVFVSDGQARAQIALQDQGIKKGRWHFLLRSGAAAHLDPTRISLRFADKGGRILFTQEVTHGYVLAGAALPMVVSLPPKTCREAATFEILLAAPAAPLRGDLPPGPRSCDS